MNWNRIIQNLFLNIQSNAPKRADYLRKKNIFGLMGENVSFSPRKIPLYPNLIRIHNNVCIAADVNFITHDISDNNVNLYLKEHQRKERVTERIGCIEIMDNVFIGANTTILYDVKIGKNCIIGANSLVNKDIPENSVAAGNPCKVIGSFEDFVSKRLVSEKSEAENIKPPVRGVSVPNDTSQYYWKEFEKQRENLKD